MARRRQRIRFEGLGDDAVRLLRDDEPTPAQAFDDRHLDADVQAALEALAPEYRAAVVLCDIEGLSYEEIAATLGVKLGTVRSRIHRGRAQLRAALDHRRPRHPGRPAATLGTRVMKRHLGERLSALIDGELSDAHANGCWRTWPGARTAAGRRPRCGCSSGGCTPWAMPLPATR